MLLPQLVRAARQEDTAPSGSVIWAIDTDPVSIVPYGSSSTSNMWGKEFIYDSLL